MRKSRDGDWHVFEETTRKPFVRFKEDATRALLNGLAGLTTRHSWRGTTCDISAPGAESTLTFEDGRVWCKIRFTSFIWEWVFPFVKNKMLSDVEHTTIQICGATTSENKRVFIVLGHDQENRRELKALLSDLGARPIILDEEDSQGMTIIESFEFHAKTCAFAIILMTPDDLSEAGSKAASSWRARQNVVLELGWFMAQLGRDRVLILYTGDIEIPSDILGVVYLRFKDSVREVEGNIQRRLRNVGLLV